MADADRMDEDFGDTSDSDDSVPQRPAAAAASARAASARAASAPAGPTARATLKGQERPVAGSNLPFPGVKRVVTKAYDGFATHLLHLAYQRKMHLVFTNEQRQWNQFYNEAIQHEFVNYKKHTTNNPGRRLHNLVKSLMKHNARVYKDLSNTHKRMSDQVQLSGKIAREREEARAKKMAPKYGGETKKKQTEPIDKKKKSAERTAINEREEIEMGLRPPNKDSRGVKLAPGAESVPNAKAAAMLLGPRPDAHSKFLLILFCCKISATDISHLPVRKRTLSRAKKNSLRMKYEQAAASNAVNGVSLKQIGMPDNNGWGRRHHDAVERTDNLAEELQRERRDSDRFMRTMTMFLNQQMAQMIHRTPKQQPPPPAPRPPSNRRAELLSMYDDNLNRISRLQSIPQSQQHQQFFQRMNSDIIAEISSQTSPTSPPSESSAQLVSHPSSESSSPLASPLASPPSIRRNPYPEELPLGQPSFEPNFDVFNMTYPPVPTPALPGFARALPAPTAQREGEQMPSRRVRQRLNDTSQNNGYRADDWDSDSYDEELFGDPNVERQDEPRGPYKSCDR